MDLANNPILNMPPVFLLLFIAWSLYWKGMALWKAAQGRDKAWFITLMIVNTAGILDILYLYLFSPKVKK